MKSSNRSSSIFSSSQKVREHIFAIVISIVSRTPLCIIGTPGQSKTLSFQIVLQNLQGSQVSPKPFCRRLPAIEPFLCLGSKYTRSEDIDYTFERAIKREQQYQEKSRDARCVCLFYHLSFVHYSVRSRSCFWMKHHCRMRRK